MKAGKLDRRIDLQRKTDGYSDSGQPIESWTNLAERIAASYSPVRGNERNTAPQWIADEQVEFWIRWNSGVEDLNPKDRIIYPAILDTSPEEEITEGRIFDIISVLEIGRREGLKIMAARKAD